MGQRLLCVFFLLFLGAHPRAVAGDDEDVARTKKELQPRPVTLKADGISNVLAQLQQQTGNIVVDRRQTKSDSGLKIELANSTFWPAVEAIAKAAGCGISTYQADARVALVDAPLRSMSKVFQGIFRITAKRVNAVRDDDAGTHVCIVTLDVAWEPRYEPLYLEVGPIQATFAADNKGVELQATTAGQGKINVAGRNAIEIDIRVPAPKRSAPKIKSLQGQFQLTGPGKMLTFNFSNPKAFKKTNPPLRQTQDGVQVSLVELKTFSDRWSVEVQIDNPGSTPQKDSFQSYLGNNRITLEKREGPDHKVWAGAEDRAEETATRAEIQYSFHNARKHNPGQPADWMLVYRAPGRIVEIGVPFAFKDLSLP
jgi:hypothetical protein